MKLSQFTGMNSIKLYSSIFAQKKPSFNARLFRIRFIAAIVAANVSTQRSKSYSSFAINSELSVNQYYEIRTIQISRRHYVVARRDGSVVLIRSFPVFDAAHWDWVNRIVSLTCLRVVRYARQFFKEPKTFSRQTTWCDAKRKSKLRVLPIPCDIYISKDSRAWLS